jgi:hypothetical protein
MNIFTFGGWIAQSVELGGLKKSLQFHTNCRAAIFKTLEDRDTFYDLSVEQYPNERFFVGTIDGEPCIQHSNKPENCLPW